MVLMTADVPEDIKVRKEVLQATWGLIILRGIQSLEGKTDAVMKDLQAENTTIREKLRALAMKVYDLEAEK